jgi:hypothetical protein
MPASGACRTNSATVTFNQTAYEREPDTQDAIGAVR